MNGHISPERLHDLVDGLVPSAERAPLEEHLRTCGSCRDQAARLAGVVEALRGLPKEAAAPQGLWAGIEERIAGTAPGAGEGETRVLPFPGAGAVGRRISLTVPQLAAAAGWVAVLSAGVVWSALSGPGVPTPGAGVAETETGAAARMVAGGNGYDEAVARLQDVVARGRDVMAPETLAALERSLATIDAAIAEVEEALRQDPSSELLARMLVNHQGAKLRALRQAATRVEPRV